MGDERPPFGTIGELTVDPDSDGVLCHWCGRWYRNLAQHARLAHGLSAEQYRDHAGLNRQTRLASPGLRAQMREATAAHIEELREAGYLFTANDPRTAEGKAAAVEAIREGLRAEGRAHRRESWDAERRAERAEQTRERNLSGELRAESAAIARGVSTRGPQTCERCGATYQPTGYRTRYCAECRVAVQREQWRDYARRQREARSEADRHTKAGRRSC